MRQGDRSRRVSWLGALAVVVAFAACPDRLSGARRSWRLAMPSPHRAGRAVVAHRPRPAAHRTATGIALPTAGKAPTISASRPGGRRLSTARRAAPHRRLPRALAAAARHGDPHARRARHPGRQGRDQRHVHLGPAHAGSGTAAGPGARVGASGPGRGFTPSAFYSSTQLDNFSAQCGFGVNETTIAQSSANPNLLVAGANTYYDNTGSVPGLPRGRLLLLRRRAALAVRSDAGPAVPVLGRSRGDL